MTLRLEDKKAIVSEVRDIACKALSIVSAEYRGLTVEQMTRLRSEARKSGVYLRVVRNNLARRAFEGTEFECAREVLVGPLILAFSLEEPSSAARLVRDFAKEHEKFTARFLVFEGRLLSAQELDRIASLPTRPEALARLLSVIQAPVTQLARTLAEPAAKMARVLAAVRDQKQAA